MPQQQNLINYNIYNIMSETNYDIFVKFQYDKIPINERDNNKNFFFKGSGFIY